MDATTAINNIRKMLGLQFKKETFMSTFLVDGASEVTNNMEEDFQVGQTLYVVKESTLAPAPEGSHTTRDGLVISVDSESTIIAIVSEDKSTDAEVEQESSKDMNYTEARDAQGQLLESSTFDVGEDVFLVKDDGSKVPAPDGEHQVVLKDTSGNENKIRIQVLDGKIIQRENVEGMMKPQMMNADFSKDIEDIKKWGIEVEDKTQLLENYIDFWKLLPNYYQSLYDHLLSKGIGYQGLIYREAVKNLIHFLNTVPNKQFVFAGFNALNANLAPCSLPL
jgi:hypothetical protein